MSQYNLLKGGYLTAISGSGYGNKNLTWDQLRKLVDDNTTSSGVPLTGGDVLYLYSDLSNRLSVSEARLYIGSATSSGTVLSGINMYYKNYNNESLTTASKSISDGYYKFIFGAPSAPQYVVATVSGLTCELYEFSIVNYDGAVSFGQDGTQTSVYVENIEYGSWSDPYSVYIHNDSNQVSNAYVVIDPTSSGSDYYVQLSGTLSGDWLSLQSGIAIDSLNISKMYNWNMGIYTNTSVSNDKLMMTNTATSSGTYVSPVFKVDNKMNSTYFIVDSTTNSGVNNISYNPSVYNGTIRVRSSDISPIDNIQIFVPYAPSWYQLNVARLRIYDGNYVSKIMSSDVGGAGIVAYLSTVDERTGTIYIASNTNFFRVSLNGVLMGSSTMTSDVMIPNVNMMCDKYGGIWSYGNVLTGNYRLYHFNSTVTVSTPISVLNSTVDFVYDLAVEMNGLGVWYTDKTNNTLNALDGTTGSSRIGIVLVKPRAICGTLDNGCWVMDETPLRVYRYDYSGNLVTTVVMSRIATRMVSDYDNGFWYYNGSYVYHVNSNGVEDIGPISIPYVPVYIRGGKGGCLVYTSTDYIIRWIDRASKTVARIFSCPTAYTNTMCSPSVWNLTHDIVIQNKLVGGFIPASFDPVWGASGTLSWKEVKKDGFYLPKTNYHQAELTLRTAVVSGVSPQVNRLIIPSPLIMQDMQAGEYRQFYIRSFLPATSSGTDFTTKLKCWWGMK